MNGLELLRAIAAQHLEKVAKNRYERALASGELGASDVAHIPFGPDAAMAHTTPTRPQKGWVDPNTLRIRQSREAMWGPRGTDLNPEQLARHRRLHGLQADRSLRELGGLPINHPLGGPATTNSGRVLVAPHAGQYLRDAVEGRIGRSLPDIVRSNLPEFVRTRMGGAPDAPLPVDQTIRHAVVEHEGGEKALMRGSAAAKRDANRSGIMRRLFGSSPEALPARHIASHLGATPILEEKQVVWRDPEAQQLLQRVRQMNPDDAKVDALHRQFGGRPDSPVQLGSRQHAEIERRAAGITPQLPVAATKRIQSAMSGAGHGIPTSGQAGTAAAVSEALEQMRGQVAKKLGPAAPVGDKAFSWIKDKAMANLRGRDIKDPADMVARLGRLRKAVRR